METDLTPVIIESPFAGEVERNLRYVRAAMHDCIVNHHEAPYASHALYTQEGVLDDDIEAERWLGIHAGFVWRKLAKKTIVYGDFGISKGMAYGIEHAEANGHEIVYRHLDDTVLAWVLAAGSQPELKLKGHVFTNGTSTSNAAAASVQPSSASMEKQVLSFIRKQGNTGATDDEIEAALNFRHQTASARRRGLVLQGYVKDSGQKRKTRAGRPATVWRAI